MTLINMLFYGALWCVVACIVAWALTAPSRRERKLKQYRDEVRIDRRDILLDDLRRRYLNTEQSVDMIVPTVAKLERDIENVLAYRTRRMTTGNDKEQPQITDDDEMLSQAYATVLRQLREYGYLPTRGAKIAQRAAQARSKHPVQQTCHRCGDVTYNRYTCPSCRCLL